MTVFLLGSGEKEGGMRVIWMVDVVVVMRVMRGMESLLFVLWTQRASVVEGESEGYY